MPLFRLLPRVNSFRLAGKRYFPDEEIELNDEQVKRFNMDLFVKVEPSIPVRAPESIVSADPVPQVPEVVESSKSKGAAKKHGFARKLKV